MSNMYGYNDYDGPTLFVKNSILYPNKRSDTTSRIDDNKKTTTIEVETTFISNEDSVAVDDKYDDSKNNDNNINFRSRSSSSSSSCSNHTTIIKNPINVVKDYNDNNNVNNDNDTYYDNPLQVGFWMDGDSLAPPCGTSITLIQQILKIIFNNTTNTNISSNDYVCLYDLGCGDGRICLEAYVQYNCTYTIGIEIELDLIERAQYLVSKLQQDQQQQEELQNEQQQQYQKQQQQKQSKTLPVFIQADLQDVLNRLVIVAKKTEKEKEQTNAKYNIIEIVSENSQQHQPQQETNGEIETTTTTTTAVIESSNSSSIIENNLKKNNNNEAFREVTTPVQVPPPPPTTTTTTSSLISIDTLPLPTIIVLYLLPESLELLRPNLTLLLQYCNNLQIVCNTWCIPNLPYTYEYEIRDDNNTTTGTSTTTSIVTSIFVYTKQCLLSL